MPVPELVRDDGSGIQKRNALKQHWIPGQARNGETDETGILHAMKNIRFLPRERKDSTRLYAGAVVLLVVMLATTAFGDVIDESLPPETPQAVKASVRQTVRSGLPQAKVVQLTRAMVQNKFNEQQIQQTHTLMMEARNSGLPVQPLMNKAFEGMAKGIDPSLILGAMQMVQSRNEFAYQRAARLSQNKTRTANLGRSIAAGLAAGLSKNDANKITEMIEQRSRSMQSDRAYSLALECFNTARDVSRLGVSSQAVTNMLANALNKGFNHHDMQAMRSAFMAQSRQSHPQNLARSYSAAILEGKGFQGGRGSDAGHGASGSGHSGSGGSGASGGGSGGSGGSSGMGGSGGSSGMGGSGGSGGPGGSGPGGGGGNQ